MLPEIDGLEVAKTIRKTQCAPIHAFSQKDSVWYKVIFGTWGRWLCNETPFSNRESQARYSALLRRSQLVPVGSGSW